MNKGFTYWLRWLAVLPGAVLASVIALIPLHFILYRTLSNFVEPYPELPERLLTPFAVCLGFVWSGARIAPGYKFETATVLFGLIMIPLGGFVFLSLFGERWMGQQLSVKGYGAAPALGFVGGLVAVYLIKRDQHKMSQAV
ncbi:MAG TPA: hypothetical protein VFV58_04230 [Blastocatellia bacterium]|jgi:hypothetical protein|nr:hypothetical protein [Blastocatellia bacterium]